MFFQRIVDGRQLYGFAIGVVVDSFFEPVEDERMAVSALSGKTGFRQADNSNLRNYALIAKLEKLYGSLYTGMRFVLGLPLPVAPRIKR